MLGELGGELELGALSFRLLELGDVRFRIFGMHARL